jgi:hypothetical protein
MEVFFVYLWLKLDILISISIFMGCTLLCSGIVYAFNKDMSPYAERYAKEKWPIYKKLLQISAVRLTLAVLLPSKTDTAVLIGTHYAVSLAESPEGAKVSSLIRKKANEYLDEELKAK